MGKSTSKLGKSTVNDVNATLCRGKCRVQCCLPFPEGRPMESCPWQTVQ